MAGVVVLAVAGGALSGCGGDDVRVDRFTVTEVGRTACSAVLDALPASVADEPRRTVAGSRYAAAYGDPPIVLRCGVGRPDGFDKFSQCQRTDGVDWFVPDSTIDDLRADVLMTTVGREPAVDVLVPAGYRPEGTAAAMVDLAPVLKAHTTLTTPCT